MEVGVQMEIVTGNNLKDLVGRDSDLWVPQQGGKNLTQNHAYPCN